MIIAVLLSAAFVTVLNQTLFLIAIPPIMGDFHIVPSQGQWLTTAFLLTNGILIPVTAFLIDKFSDRKLLITAISIFTAGTLLGAFAPSFPVLLTARIIQAAGAGIMMPLMQTVILTMFPPAKRGSAMGMVGLVIGFAPSIGPTLSGWIVDHYSWRYLFYIVLPIALIVLVAAICLMKNLTLERETKIDFPSLIISSFGWGGLLYGFSLAGSEGWTSPTVLISLLIGAITLVIFIRRQLRLDQPILEFRVFKSSVFSLTTLLTTLIFALMVGTQLLLPLYMQDVRGLPAMESGLVLLPGAFIMGVMSPITGRIFDRFGGRGLTISGFSLILLASILYINLSMETPIGYIALFFAVMMTGMSMLMMPLATAGINALPPHLIAHGTAMNNTIRMVGGSIGTALLISIMSYTQAHSVAANPLSAMMDGIHTSFIVAGFMALIGFIVSFTLKKKSAQNISTSM
jgi:EmrB/QacA subfamily drug resistance transporter